MIIKIATLGCKVNQYESGEIVAALNHLGYNASEGLGLADVYIINSCSVTAEADRKSRQYISKMRKLNHDCDIIVIGCSSQNRPQKFQTDNVIAIGGTANKTEFVINAIKSLANAPKYSIISDRILYNNDNFCQNSSCNNISPVFNKTRAFVKIQDGCNRFCSYCIIPYLRGRSVSRSIESIVTECKQIHSREVVLTGIDMSAYGIDIGVKLTDLLKALIGVSERVRIGSLECEVISREMLEVMRDGDYCPHFHLSLQSGCNDVLRTMNRHYSAEYYYEKVRLIREYFPLAGITTDVIVGFPTETDENFRESYEFVKACEFSDVHMFPYSNREGTLASKKYKQLPSDIVSLRVAAMLELKGKLRDQFLRKNIGTIAPVYTETTQGNLNVGYTPNYIKVYSCADCGSIQNLMLTEPYDDGILGVPI